jgi:3-phenylpropionate/trans-cinnamate dioxygenase ferredoxin subunit
MAGFVKVAKTEEIPEGGFKSFEVDFTRFVVAHTSDGYFAFIDECTHDSEPFGKGKLKGNEIVCTRHGARFDVRSGAVTAPPAIVPLDTFEVKVEGNDILVRLD